MINIVPGFPTQYPHGSVWIRVCRISVCSIETCHHFLPPLLLVKLFRLYVYLALYTQLRMHIPTHTHTHIIYASKWVYLVMCIKTKPFKANRISVTTTKSHNTCVVVHTAAVLYARYSSLYDTTTPKRVPPYCQNKMGWCVK